MKQSPTKTVDRALDILEVFVDAETGLTLSDIANNLGLSSSTVYRIVTTLENRGFLKKDKKTRKYYIGNNILKLAESNNEGRYDALRTTSIPVMKGIHEKYNENIGLFVADGEDKLCLERFESTRALRLVVMVGEKATMKVGSVGKVLLAYMDEGERDTIIADDGWPEKEELEKIKMQGYALSVGEREEGLVGLAAPVFNSQNKCIASISLSGPSSRFINESLSEKIFDVIKAAREISEKL